MYIYMYLTWIICIYTYIDGLYVCVHVSNMDYMYVYIHKWIICICTLI